MTRISDECLDDLASAAEKAASTFLYGPTGWSNTASALRELQDFRRRYAFAENQRLCIGYDGSCDGDLEGLPHDDGCPARTKDLLLRPYLYEPFVESEEK